MATLRPIIDSFCYNLYQWHWQRLTSHLSEADFRLSLPIKASLFVMFRYKTYSKNRQLSNYLYRQSENMTQPCASDAHNLTSPSHSRRHSCYYISATTANDALASRIYLKNIPTLVPRQMYVLNKLTHTWKIKIQLVISQWCKITDAAPRRLLKKH